MFSDVQFFPQFYDNDVNSIICYFVRLLDVLNRYVETQAALWEKIQPCYEDSIYKSHFTIYHVDCLVDISTFKSMHDGIPGPYRAVKLFDGDVMGNVTKIIFNTPNRKKIMGNFIVV